jgi:hypothetical protein
MTKARKRKGSGTAVGGVDSAMMRHQRQERRVDSGRERRDNKQEANLPTRLFLFVLLFVACCCCRLVGSLAIRWCTWSASATRCVVAIIVASFAHCSVRVYDLLAICL